MAAPLYSQAQVAKLIAMPKFVPHDEWEKRTDGRPGPEERQRIRAYPVDESDLTEFHIERCKWVARGEASFTLLCKLVGYPEEALCRYEIQLATHRNPKWFPPAYVGKRVPHKHVYNERAMREFGAWDKCATPLVFKPAPKRKMSLQQYIDRMIAPEFLKDVHVDIHDPDSMGLFYRG